MKGEQREGTGERSERRVKGEEREVKGVGERGEERRNRECREVREGKVNGEGTEDSGEEK